MRIAELREFIRLSQTLNFTQTAKEFYLSQPVLSKHISNIEAELGTQLFTRSSCGVQLTNSGKAFTKGAQSVVNAYDDALQQLDEARKGYTDRIVIGYLYGASCNLLLPALDYFKRVHPEVSIQLKACEIDETLEMLSNDKVDFAVTTLLDSDSFLATGQFHVEELYPDCLAAGLPIDHPLAQKKSISIYELAEETIILAASPFMMTESKIIEEVLAPVKDSIRTSNSIHDLTSAQILFHNKESCFLTFHHIKNAFSDVLVMVPIQEASHIKFSVGAVWKERRHSQALHDLADCMKQAVRKYQ